MMKSLIAFAAVAACQIAAASYPEVTFDAQTGGFPLISHGRPAAIWVDESAPPGLRRVAEWFADDLERLCGKRPKVAVGGEPPANQCILFGVLGQGGAIDRLVREGEVDASGIAGQVEASLTCVADQPAPGVDRALVVAGSDKRGGIYGLLDLSRAAGVSPWYWWADVPVNKRTELYVAGKPFIRTSPKVRYRGIFLNDEAPALADWAQEKFGGCNSKFYIHVYELILRLRGNYLWPAMWGRSLFDDDPESQRLADELGIVLATSHHEPMHRAHVEWARYGKGPWDYSKNAETLRQFWREGIRRMKDFESVVTVGMRGDGDEPMTEEANIELLQRIVRDQRAIIAEEQGRDPAQQPQVWALYKEVQEYYDRGMRVPDDITLLLCDDNWGNVRRLPRPDDPPHAGGYGLYYHFDYVGDPRNYKWLNTNVIARVWEQMHLTWRHGVDRIWIVNVGDLKPMEQPIDFFLTLAWDPDAFPAEGISQRLNDWRQAWAREQFGEAPAAEIAALIAGYTNLNARRKPELLDADTYSLDSFREWERIVDEWRNLVQRAERVEKSLPAQHQSTYYQLVLHPMLACANLNELYYAVARNRRYAEQGRALTNELADDAERLFAHDEQLTRRYHELEGGKWNHMMAQTHIGYTYWQQPDVQAMPEVRRIELPAEAAMGVAAEGGDPSTLPPMLPRGPSRWIDVYNRGRGELSFAAETSQPWLVVTPALGKVGKQTRLEVSVDWTKFPAAESTPTSAAITIRGSDGKPHQVTASAFRPGAHAHGFVEANGYVSADATSYEQAVDDANIHWEAVADLGRAGGAVIATRVNGEPTRPEGQAPRLEYPIHLVSDGEITVDVYLSPTLDYYGADESGEDQGLRFAVSIDDQPPATVDMHADRSTPEHNANPWRQRVASNVHVVTTPPIKTSRGNHTLKFWRVDPGVVLQKLVVKTGEIPASYLGPPESPQANDK